MNIVFQSTDIESLEAQALRQGGYFDRQDALAYGITDRLLTYHVKAGRFERCFPGVYRLARAPIAPHDDLLQAIVWTNYRGAISHESALALYGLSDVMPSRVELTVPPDFGRGSSLFVLHRTMLTPEDVSEYDGVRVTTPARAVVDAAAAGADPEQIAKAVLQGMDRALFGRDELLNLAERRRYRNRRPTLALLQDIISRAQT